MKDKAELLLELNHTQSLLQIIVHQRMKKMIMRWFIGAIFYFSFWHITWIRYLFWMGVGMEIMLLAFTLFSYYHLRKKEKWIRAVLQNT